ncbi:MAG TPA: DUF1295 domain-containing protein [Kofleriaceae bacterium]|nr:DUF1295 domain-containing protein [Kofleriaceae bacterium]
MVGEILVRLGAAWATAAVLMIGLWLWSRRVHNAAWVDVGWAGSFALVIGTWTLAFGTPRAAAPLAIVIVAWSLRLAAHLANDRVLGHPEEGRYVELRRRWGAGRRSADRAFLVFFQAQALLVGVLASAFVVPWVAAPHDDGRRHLRWVAVGLAAVAVIGEAVADAQLHAWKQVPAHKGKVCDVGLWAVSRHPNYFFEWLIWVAYLTYSLAFPWGAIAAGAPALMLATLFKVTGIPATEAQSLRSRGDAYRDYQRRVSVFVPWFPRRKGAGASGGASDPP